MPTRVVESGEIADEDATRAARRALEEPDVDRVVCESGGRRWEVLPFDDPR